MSPLCIIIKWFSFGKQNDMVISFFKLAKKKYLIKAKEKHKSRKVYIKKKKERDFVGDKYLRSSYI